MLGERGQDGARCRGVPQGFGDLDRRLASLAPPCACNTTKFSTMRGLMPLVSRAPDLDWQENFTGSVSLPRMGLALYLLE